MPFFLKMMQSTEFARLKRYVVTFIGDDASSIKEPAHVSEAFQRMYTIRLIGSETLAYRNERIKLRKIAEAVLFNLSFGSGTSLNLKTSWERETYRFAERRNEIVQFPKRTYETDLLSYYHLALSTDSLILRYISLYKILEFFFSSSAEQELHARMTERLISPDFSHSKPEQLRQLTTVVRKHDQRMDEQRMLSTVIERFFPPDEIIAWLNSLDENSRQSYIGATPIFGEICSVDTNPESLASSLAKRIYHIRNVLVHNKEGELPRFIPFSGQEAILLKEMPLLVFLAERVILKTGKDL
jgi:hypothetical protein